MSDHASSHAKLMDSTYRYQRLIYDITRRYYLLGRDHLISELNVPKDGAVLEVACGTGRNLSKVRQVYPGGALFGLDISEEMLRSAKAKLGADVPLMPADARDFDARALFDRETFDRVFISYGVSMIPDWSRAARQALDHVAPGGSLHIVDFGDQAGLPSWFRTGLHAWLRKFHVSPRSDFRNVMEQLSLETGTRLEMRSLYRGYAVYGVIRRS
ncbi:class I SAM-dependent methyltransferase [Thalassococcus sp. S3]|uniref:class I SAM-dependent methyltransferase n=1 Tax=Thalassococcus sp. S3 TaxID=2017482 RepID=UPI001023FC13|nr:class I SAM-dependent methyltransferase [Thalassococcus sp. S3]QBF33886.1 SAM-dependent methyltransferase [Thalassococcus sp. S3]